MRFLGLVILAACFSPDVIDGSFVCGGATTCPPGYACGCDQRCWLDPSQHTCGIDAPKAADARTIPDAPFAVDARISLPDVPIVFDAPAPDASAPSPDASVPKPDANHCGDGVCQDALGENCETCHADCGDCNCSLGCLTASCRACPPCGPCMCNGTCDFTDALKCPSDCGN